MSPDIFKPPRAKLISVFLFTILGVAAVCFFHYALQNQEKSPINDSMLSNGENKDASGALTSNSGWSSDGKGQKPVSPVVSTDYYEGETSRHGLFYDTKIGGVLSRFFSTLGSFDQVTLAEQAAALDALKSNRDVASNELIDAYYRVDQSDYNLRYDIMYTLAELGSTVSLPIFVDVSESPLPPRVSESHINQQTAHGTFKEELFVRMRAVSGLKNLGDQDVKGARDALLRLSLNAENITIRSDAIKAYLRTSDRVDQDSAYLADLLPSQYHELIDITPTDLSPIADEIFSDNEEVSDQAF